MEHPSLLRRFAFDAWANQRVHDALAEVDRLYSDESALLAHILCCQRLWWARLRGEPFEDMDLFPEPTRPRLQGDLELLPRLWAELVGTLTPEGMAADVTYVDSEGPTWTTTVGDALTQVLFHGVHHRGQIASSLRRQGVEPPILDYIVFHREVAAER